MKNNKRKGFTIVELVIVIAVIGILAAVLIPTFSSVITKANESKQLQQLNAAYKEALADVIADGVITSQSNANQEVKAITIGDVEYSFTFTGPIETLDCDVTKGVAEGYTAEFDDGVWTVTKTPTT